MLRRAIDEGGFPDEAGIKLNVAARTQKNQRSRTVQLLASASLGGPQERLSDSFYSLSLVAMFR